ncbi:MAG TPA: alpha-hydroxy acid oxidase [Xanthobacteraceae bacterium]|nr:alpha-hydroxy acid oxidase [Xanthobacteraceae bacterium]
MDDRTKIVPPAAGTVPNALPMSRPVPGPERQAKLRRRFPTVFYLREAARRRIPQFGFEATDGGAGRDGGVARNAAALDAIELMPRYGIDKGICAMETELFGRRYAAPIGIAPMGLPGVVWPGAEKYLAAAANKARVPYTAGTVASSTVEELAEIAEDMLWFQLYRMPHRDHADGFDLVRRAQAAGAQVLMITMDVPLRTKRPREVRQGLVLPFRMQAHTVWDVLTHPAWLMAYAEHGLARFSNYKPYVEGEPTAEKLSAYSNRDHAGGGAFSWEEVARYRDVWKGPLIAKGIQHPQDAEKAVSLGCDGVLVSNHGGRQIEGLPASVDVLPAIVQAVGSRATVLLDSGVRTGLDVVRALALGAKAAFAGKAFLYGLGAMGGEGAGYVIDLFKEEIRDALRQCGINSVEDARKIELRHPGRWTF